MDLAGPKPIGNWQVKDLNEGQQRTNAVGSEVDGLNQQIWDDKSSTASSMILIDREFCGYCIYHWDTLKLRYNFLMKDLSFCE